MCAGQSERGQKEKHKKIKKVGNYGRSYEEKIAESHHNLQLELRHRHSIILLRLTAHAAMHSLDENYAKKNNHSRFLIAVLWITKICSR